MFRQLFEHKTILAFGKGITTQEQNYPGSGEGSVGCWSVSDLQHISKLLFLSVRLNTMADNDGKVVGSSTLQTRWACCNQFGPAEVEYWTATPVLVQGGCLDAHPPQTDQKETVTITTQVWETRWHSYADIKIERATYCARVLTPSWEEFAQSNVRAMDKDACVRIIGKAEFDDYLPF